MGAATNHLKVVSVSQLTICKAVFLKLLFMNVARWLASYVAKCSHSKKGRNSTDFTHEGLNNCICETKLHKAFYGTRGSCLKSDQCP